MLRVMREVVGKEACVRFNKEPVSAYTHMAGFLAALIGVVPLIVLSLGQTSRTVGMAVYGGSLLLVFLASTVYHLLDIGEKGNRWLQRIDHAAIFLLIAGTYIPAFMFALDGAWRISMLSVVSGIAVAGVVLKLLWIDLPRRLSAAMYLAMGWIVVVPAWIALPRLTTPSLTWLVIGGAVYTLGAIVYATKRPDPLPGRFGHHEVFHLFVLGGAGCHYVAMLDLVRQTYPPFV